MILLTMAHKGEAQEFIRRKHNIRVEFYFTGLYRHEDELLLLTGSESENIGERISAVILYFGSRITDVLNFGIAGALNKELQINQVYGVKRVIAEDRPPTQENYYLTANLRGLVDCVSTAQPVLTDEQARSLAARADIVDMENWHVAMACQKRQLPLKSYKLISDFAGSGTDSKAIRKNAALFSRHLFDFYKKLPDRGK